MLNDDPLLSRKAAALLNDPMVEPLVSAVSAYEICYKNARGKLSQATCLCDAFAEEIAGADCTPLALKVAHADAAAKLNPSHGDPFDRLLIAQALVERVPIVSNEAVFDRFGVEWVW